MQPTHTRETIDRFTGKYRFLSNFWPCEVPYDGVMWPSAEHAYQAAKTEDTVQKALIATLTTAGQAKRMGRRVTMRPDWNEIKLDVMLDIVHAKFFGNVGLGHMLVDTSDARLVEGNDWGDRFWGVCNGEGRNHLGLILEQVRDRLVFMDEIQSEIQSEIDF